ncbi:hypothetical protein BVG79_01072 [Ketogulonicigenium robustum]|uniref:Uncharacterized protein n=1 Tax=Ketogulonicigenium robustum TaxID=92947 RepID=A0A1W6NYU0_9RHOB|nr:hypothetical protein [Ketogulonicigenium robustum]ARO14418.1 hypothetical protein BVG79_01072 [Ketogulonicigenium robustum]
MITNADPRKQSEKTTYGLIDAGLVVSAPAYRKLQSKLVPVGDGLFGSEFSQTFTYRE